VQVSRDAKGFTSAYRTAGGHGEGRSARRRDDEWTAFVRSDSTVDHLQQEYRLREADPTNGRGGQDAARAGRSIIWREIVAGVLSNHLIGWAWVRLYLSLLAGLDHPKIKQYQGDGAPSGAL
jgi:hypothetical protein